MDSVFWTLSIVLLCFNIGFMYGFNDQRTRIPVPLALVQSGHLVKRNSQSPLTSTAPEKSRQGSPQQNRAPSLGPKGSTNQEATQPRSDSLPISISSSSNDSEPSTPALASKPLLPIQSRKSNIHKSSRRPKPDSDKASLSDESPQNRAQLPRRITGRPGPPGMQSERQNLHSSSPSANGAYPHSPAYQGPQQHLPGSQYPPERPAGNPPEIVEVEPGNEESQSPPALPAGNQPGIVEVVPRAHMPPRYPSDPQMGSKPPIVVMTGPPSRPSLDPNPLSWEEIREFLNTPVLADLFSGFGWSFTKVQAVFRKLPLLLDQIETE